LGLAIARWVVDLHHGNIAIVDAEDGIGCRIRITLPDVSLTGGNNDEHEHGHRHGTGQRGTERPSGGREG
jgi:hypothetical protein